MSELPQVVMVIEDNVTMRNFLQACVAGNGYDAAVFDDHDQAIAHYGAQPSAAVILGLSWRNPELPFTTIAALKRIDASVPIVVLPGQARTEALVRAMHAGASDFISAPFDETDVELVLARALGRARGLPGPLRTRGRCGDALRPTLVGSSRFIERVRDFIDRAAMTDEPVLISGDSGTGKTLVARTIIAASARRDKPFVKVNCASRQHDLLEAEIFGLKQELLGEAGLAAPGKFESANHGTLVLDGVGEMSEPLQLRLLKLLQDNEYSPLGRTRGSKLDVRIIATASTDPERAVCDGYLRQELFFRLNVLSLQLLPLRLRRDDIPVLARHLLTKCAHEFGVQAPELSPQAMQILMEHDWPGNVRELDNVIRRIVLLGAELSLEDEIAPSGGGTVADPQSIAVPSPGGLLALAGGGSLKEAARSAAREVERALILRALEQTRWNRRKAADILGVSYRAQLKKLRDINVPRT
jgi:two-component system response regulator AtoC